MNMNSETPLHFLACGLDNVYLVNGFHYGKNGNGEEILVIQDLDGLHSAIALAIADSTAPLDAKTFKFLRKHLDMAQRQIADIMDLSVDAVSKWERNESPVPRTADLIVKTMAKEKCSNNAEMLHLIERYNMLDREEHEEMLRLSLDENRWAMAVAA